MANPSIVLGWDNSALKAGAAQASQTVDKFSASSRKSLSSISAGGFGTAVTSIIGVGAAFAGLSEAVNSAANFEAIVNGLRAVSGQGEDVTATLDRLRDVAKLPGLGLEEAIVGATNLRAVGFSAKQAEEILGNFGNALATVGKGKADLDGVIRALSQIVSKGKISAEEINQLAERLPQIRVAMQSAFGSANTEVLQSMGLSAEEFVTKVTSEFGKLPKMTGGLKNDIENLSDAWKQFKAIIGETIAPVVTSGINAITSKFADLQSHLLRGEASTRAFTAAFAQAQELAAGGDMTGSLEILNKLLEDTQAKIGNVGPLDRLLHPGEVDSLKELHSELLKIIGDMDAFSKSAPLPKAEPEGAKEAKSRAAAELEAAKAIAKKEALDRATKGGKLKEAQDKTLEMQLDDEEKLVNAKAKREALEQAIAAARNAGDKGAELDNAIALEGVLQTIIGLEKAAAAAEEQQAEKRKRISEEMAQQAEEEAQQREMLAKTQAESLAHYQAESAILSQQAAGHGKKAEAMQRALRIADETKRIMESTGLGEQQALTLARQRIDLEDRSKRGPGTTRADGRHRIQGYSQDQGRARDFTGLDRRAAATERASSAPPAGGRDMQPDIVRLLTSIDATFSSALS